MQNNAPKRSNAYRAVRNFLLCIVLAGHTAVQNNPTELSHHAAIALLTGCGAFMCYKEIKSIKNSQEYHTNYEKIILAAPLHILLTGAAGCTLMSVIHLQKIYAGYAGL